MTRDQKDNLPAERPTVRAGGQLGAFIPQNLEEAWRMADALANQAGDMVPECYRGKPGAVLMAMQKGAELGMAPLASLQSIVAIKGRATLWGDALPALVLNAGHKIEEWSEGEGDNRIAFCRVTRKDGQTFERNFSVDDAKRAGLWETEAKVKRRKRDGSGTYETDNDSPWYRYPKRMLQMRARAWAVRDGAADVTMGLAVYEEVRDTPARPVDARDVTPSGGFAAMGTAAREAEKAQSAPETPDDAQVDDAVVIDQEPQEGADDAPDADGEAFVANPAHAFPMDPEFDEGAKAFKDGVKYDANPHTGQAGHSWAGGWIGAEKAAKK